MTMFITDKIINRSIITSSILPMRPGVYKVSPGLVVRHSKQKVNMAAFASYKVNI